MGKPQTATKNKWNAKTYDQLRVNVKKGEREKIKAHAEAQGLSLNAYINKLIAEDMNKAGE
ncbi:toxin-antitoxin system HicB family antitoxin [Ruminococcus sp.]|uniref:toxin-antitoxin system HicB family antitoxin n=1 Tax=Ruminococcus sp. TaxID=41978 RepID=UPI0025E3198E|nr:toxin-antitoxin system HicB family antitoxin [Ruminococcus sp.]MBQ8966271.1 toxin-antitoxin system HicB family antitoxin [Ruminococcus sp.]